MKKTPKKGLSVDDPEIFFNFYNAVIEKNYETANKMLVDGWDINKSWCFSPLIMAIHDENLDAINWLINAGADVNYPDSCGIKPLTRSVLQKNHGIAELLLRKGANPNSQDGQFCNTAFMCAVEEQLTDIVKLLFHFGLKINKSPESYGLAMAAKHRHTELCEILLGFGFPVEIKEIPTRGSHAYARINYSPLGYAAYNNDVNTCKLLITHGANPDLVPEHTTDFAVEIAIEKGNYESSVLLLQNGANTRSRKTLSRLIKLPKFGRKENSNSIFKEIINIHSLMLDTDEQLELWIDFSRYKNYELLDFMIEKGFILKAESLKFFDEYTERNSPSSFFPLDAANHARSLLGLNKIIVKN